MRTTLLSALTLLPILLASAAEAAPKRAWHVGTPSDAVSRVSSPYDKAVAYLDEQAGTLQLDRQLLRFAKQIDPKGGGHIVRFTQTIDGVPVLGGAVAVRVSAAGQVLHVIDRTARDLFVDTTPALDRQAAESALSQQVGASLQAEQAELVISQLGGQFGEGALLWQLDVRDAPGGTRYFVDAHNGQLHSQRPLATHAQGRVYAMNSVETPAPVDVELLDLDVAAPQLLGGWGGLLTVANYVSGGSQNGFVLEQVVTPNSGEDFLYDPPADVSDATDAFAQVNLYHHLTSMRTYAAGLGVAIDQPEWKLTAVANALEGGQPLDNAFFSQMGQSGTLPAPNLIAIGQGTINDFAYDSDVFKHEFGHYFTHNAVGYNLGQLYINSYGLQPHSGSIDEGVSDYFACSDNDDAEFGEASLGLIGAERDLTDISRTCPTDVVGEVHEDGELIGSLAWSVRVALGKDLGDSVVWGAVAALTPGATLGEFGRALIARAQELEAASSITADDVTTIRGLVTARGLDDCDEVLTLDAGETIQTTILGLALLGQAFGQNCAGLQSAGIEFQGLFQYRHQPAAGDTVLRFQTNATPVSGGASNEYTIYARKGSFVTFKSSGFLPEVGLFDLKVDVDGNTGELVIDDVAGFDPSAEYYFAIMNRGCPTMQFSVNTSNEPIGSGTGGGGTGGSGTGGDGTGGGNNPGPTDDDGCDCNTAGTTSSSGAPFGFALLGFAAWLRSKRRRS